MSRCRAQPPLLRLMMALACAWLGCRAEAHEPASRPVVSVTTSTQAPARAPTPPAPTEQAVPPRDAVRRFAGTTLDEDSLVAALASSPVVSFRAVGSTSTVFRTALKGSLAAAFKAATVRRPRGPHAEVAAYRLARLLGLGNVPPAVSRRVPLAELRDKLAPDDAARWPDLEASLLVGRDGRVQMAAIYWIDELRELPRAAEIPLQTRLAGWLSLASPLGDADRELAGQLGTLLAFDYLIGNWDRWSGSNVKGSADGRIVYMRDHDAAFPGRLSESLQRRMLDPVVHAQRFSLSFYRALRALTREAFERELAAEPLSAVEPLVEPHALDAMLDRRQTLLSHIAATVQEHGADAVFAFP